MKRFLALLITLALALIATPALTETVDLTEPVEIELMAYYVMDVPENDPIMLYLSEKFNVKFHLTITNIDNYIQTLNMRIASDEIPDWFRVTDQSVYNQLAEDGMLLNVSDFVDRYDFSNIADTFELPNANALATNGIFYRVPDTVGVLNGGFYYRKDWLDELGIAAPTNYDELRDALAKIVEADPDGKGTTGLTAYSIGFLESAAPAWLGYVNFGRKPDGGIIHKFEDENYKAMFKYWADLYANKLLDAEFFVNSYETCMEKLASGRAGFYIMNMNTTWWSNNKANLAQYDINAELGALIPFPTGLAGNKAPRYFGFTADSSFSVNVSEEKGARMLAVMDYLLSEEGRDLTLYGFEEGVYYDLVDGEKIQKEDVVNAEWGQVQHFMGEIADFGSNDRLARDPVDIKWQEYLNNPDNVCYDKIGDYFYSERASVIWAELYEIQTRYLTAFLTGEMDIDAAWDEFQQALKDAGLEEYKAIIKAYADEKGIIFDEAVSAK